MADIAEKVSYPIRGEEDVPGALELFRLNYDLLMARGRNKVGRRASEGAGGL